MKIGFDYHGVLNTFPVIKEIGRGIINELFIITQPAHLQKISGKRLSAAARDSKRANLIREKLGGM